MEISNLRIKSFVLGLAAITLSLVSCFGAPRQSFGGIPGDLPNDPNQIRLVAVGPKPEERLVELKNSVHTIELTNKGAAIVNDYANSYKENGKSMDMILHGPDFRGIFLTYPGKSSRGPILDTFNIEQNEKEVVFYRDFAISAPNGEATDKVIEIRKTFRVADGDEFMTACRTQFIPKSGNINIGDWAFTTGFEGEIAPSFTPTRADRANIRTPYIMLDNGKNKKQTFAFSGNIFTYEQPVKWTMVTGQYFSAIVAPQNTNVFSSVLKAGTSAQTQTHRLLFSTRANSDGSAENVFYSYIGPQLKDKLDIYSDARDNSLGLEGLYLHKAMETGGGTAWLQRGLKGIMGLFYKIIPNWGVAVILLTLLVRLALLPLSIKGAVSSARMQKLLPAVDQIKTQYSNNPQRMQQEIAMLYKRNGVSMTANLWPMLIQLPILFAMLGLLTKHFELRGATFIPGWITDLSAPESIATLPFKLPLLGNKVSLLPFIYCASMIVSMLVTQKQNAAQAANPQGAAMGKVLTWGMPIMLFFALYQTASGLLLYWTCSNLFMFIQQMAINKWIKTQDATVKISNKRSKK